MISNQGKFTYPKDLGKALSKELNDRGIKSITVGISSECKQVEYTTNWTEYSIGTLYIIKKHLKINFQKYEL